MNLTLTDARSDKPVVITLTPKLRYELEWFESGSEDCDESHTRFWFGTDLLPKSGFFCVLEPPCDIEFLVNEILDPEPNPDYPIDYDEQDRMSAESERLELIQREF